MKIFLYYIKGIPQLEEYADRHLICSVASVSENENELELTVVGEEIDGLSKLAPKSNYALLYDYQNGQPTELKYYRVFAYEVLPQEEGVKLTLCTGPTT